MSSDPISVREATSVIIAEEQRVQWLLQSLNSKLVQPLRLNILSSTSGSRITSSSSESRRRQDQQKFRFSTATPQAAESASPDASPTVVPNQIGIAPPDDGDFLSPVFVPRLSKAQLQALFAHWDTLLSAHTLFLSHLKESFGKLAADSSVETFSPSASTSIMEGGISPALEAIRALQHPVVTYFLAEHGSYCVNFAKNTAPTLMFLQSTTAFMGGLLSAAPLQQAGPTVASTFINEYAMLFRGIDKFELEQYVTEALDHVRFSFATFEAAAAKESVVEGGLSRPAPSSLASRANRALYSSFAPLFGERARPSSSNGNGSGPNHWEQIRRQTISQHAHTPRLFEKPQGPFEELLLAMGVVLGSRYRVIELQRCLTNHIKSLFPQTESAQPTKPPRTPTSVASSQLTSILSTAVELELGWLETARAASVMASRNVSLHHSQTPLLRIIEQTQNPKQKNYMARTILLNKVIASKGVAQNQSVDSAAKSPLKSKIASFWSSSREASPDLSSPAEASATEAKALLREGRVHKRYGRVGGTHCRYMVLWDGLLCYFEEVAEDHKSIAPLRSALDSLWEDTRHNAQTSNNAVGIALSSQALGKPSSSKDLQQERRERMQARLQQAGVIYTASASGSSAKPSSSITTNLHHDPSPTTSPPKKRPVRVTPAAVSKATVDRRYMGGGGTTKAGGFFGACCTADALEEGPLRTDTPTDDSDTALYFTDIAATKRPPVAPSSQDLSLQAAVGEVAPYLLQQALLPHHQAVDHGGSLVREWLQARSLAGSRIVAGMNSGGNKNDFSPVDGIIGGDFSGSRFTQRRADFMRTLQRARASGNASALVASTTTHHDELLRAVSHKTNPIDDSAVEASLEPASRKLNAFNDRTAAINNEGPGVMIRYRVCQAFEPGTFKVSIPGFSASAVWKIVSQVDSANPKDGNGQLLMDNAFYMPLWPPLPSPQSEEQERANNLCFEIVVPERRYVFFADSLEEKLLWTRDISKMLVDRGLAAHVLLPDDPIDSSLSTWIQFNHMSQSPPQPTPQRLSDQQISCADDCCSLTSGERSSLTASNGGPANRQSIRPIVPQTEMEAAAYAFYPASPHQPIQRATNDTAKEAPFAVAAQAASASSITFQSRLAQQAALRSQPTSELRRDVAAEFNAFMVASTVTNGDSPFPRPVAIEADEKAVSKVATCPSAAGTTHHPSEQAAPGVAATSSIPALSLTPPLPPKSTTNPYSGNAPATPGLLQRRGSFRNSCRTTGITGIVSGTPRIHHHSRTFSASIPTFTLARTPTSTSFVGARSASFASLPEETFGTPNTATTPLRSKQPSNAFADERQLFPALAHSTTNSYDVPPPYSPAENVYDEDNYDVHTVHQHPSPHKPLWSKAKEEGTASDDGDDSLSHFRTQNSHASDHYLGADEPLRPDTATPAPPSEVRRRAVLDELAIIDSDSDSDSEEGDSSPHTDE